MNECTECGCTIHPHMITRWNCEDEPVCIDCAVLLPNYCVSYSEARSEFFGVADYKGCEMSSAWVKTRKEANTAILEMCQKLWGGLKPVQEEE